MVPSHTLGSWHIYLPTSAQPRSMYALIHLFTHPCNIMLSSVLGTGETDLLRERAPCEQVEAVECLPTRLKACAGDREGSEGEVCIGKVPLLS